MRRLLACFVGLAVPILALAQTPAQQLVERSAAAIGGLDKLRAVTAVRTVEDGIEYFLSVGVPIKAVIAADFMWSHYAGIREYIARGVHVYTPSTNVADLQRILAAPHTLAPDSLARAPRPAVITGVASRVTIGTGPNRIELISATGPGTDYGKRMLLAYLPERRLLYASDLLPTPAFEPNFVGQGTVDVAALVARERLSVDSVVALHIAPRAWAPIADSVKARY